MYLYLYNIQYIYSFKGIITNNSYYKKWQIYFCYYIIILVNSYFKSRKCICLSSIGEQYYVSKTKKMKIIFIRSLFFIEIPRFVFQYQGE